MTGGEQGGSVEQGVREENQRLRRAVQELSVLNDLALAIGASSNSDDIMNIIINKSLSAIEAEQGSITLVSDHPIDSRKTLVRAMGGSGEFPVHHVDQNLLGWMLHNKKPLLINHPTHDQRFQGVKWPDTIHSLLCAPLLIKGELKGVLTIFNKRKGEPFADNDLRLLTIMASQSAQVLENARLSEQEKQLSRMQEEMRLAYQIQIGLQPKVLPQIAGYDIAVASTPAMVVGGDYFDLIASAGKGLIICIGDVCGKGLPASLLMANLQATIRSQSLLSPTPKQCLERSNKLLYQSTSSEKFATFFYAILDTEQHSLYFSNAGHDYPLLFSEQAGACWLESSGPPLGIMPETVFAEEVMALSAGDVIVLYSDGIKVGNEKTGYEFGEKELLDLVARHHHRSAGALVESILAAVKECLGSASQPDDITLVVVKRVTA
jgi:phosphoserine phosphatase RsbU/P